MQSVITKDLNVVAGDTKAYTLTFQKDSLPVDITGWTVTMMVTSKSSKKTLFTKNVTHHTDPSNGVTEVELAIGDTDQFPETYLYSIRVDTGSGQVSTVLKGNFIVTLGQKL